MKRKIKRILIVIAIILVGIAAFFYWGIYSEGTRSGVVMKISSKGVLFKTYEGQLDLQGFGAVNSDNQFSEVWEFSVDGDNELLIEKLEKASLGGRRVELRYIERYSVIPWRGDTEYFVREVLEGESE